MACRTCYNNDNWRPGIVLDLARFQRASYSKGCKHGYTEQQISDLKKAVECKMYGSDSALQKYTLNVYLQIIGGAVQGSAKLFCDARLNLIKDELERTNC